MRPSSEAERSVGIDWHVTDGPPCSARVKSAPEDFMVEELVSIPGMTTGPRADYFPLYRVEKRSVDTMHMAREISAALRSRVSYAGLKDKRAVAVQYLSPSSRRSAWPAKVVREKFIATLVGYVPAPLGRSALVGNRFSVVLRSCCADVGKRVTEAMEAASSGRIPNFYGLQRFGVSGAGTHRVGRAMVKGEFREAVTMMLAHDKLGARPEVAEALREERYEDLVNAIPETMDTEAAVARELARHPGDWVRALRAIPVKLRRLHVQAYQSFIFNRTMSLAVKEGADFFRYAPGDNWAEASEDGLRVSNPRGVRDPPTGNAVPLVQLAGYAFRDYGSRFDALTKRVLGNESVEPAHFYIQGMQEVSQDGGFRGPSLAKREGAWAAEGDTDSMKFTLPKGQYATVLLREVVKAQDPAGAGLA